MSVILNKKIISKLYESEKSIIYRAFDNIDRRDVILKVLKEDCPDPNETARYKNEYETIRSLEIESVINAYSFERHSGSYVLILEDIKGVSLNNFCANQNLSIEEFLEIAINIVKSLGSIHERNIIHKNVNPSNIIYNSLSRQIKIIDFGISSFFSMGFKTIIETRDIESDLSYISPEQTGRMDCPIDFRSDLYSLGISLYEMLVGVLPFTHSNPMEMVSAHFTKLPIEPCRRNPDLPKSISDIVMKLIEKNPDNRYQNTFSVINDLTQCRHFLKKKGQKFEFAVQTPRPSNKFKICDRIFGRDKEINILSSLFESVCAGQKKIAMVSGNAGIGKTALVMEFWKKNMLNKGYFISGKFDQAQQDIPYGAIVNAFSQLIQKILMEKESIFKQYKKSLQTSLGNNGQLMIDLFPELEYIIGPQNPSPELPIIEAQNRFAHVFKNFIRGFMNLNYPIVFFLDDLQWADVSSLDFLQKILFSKDIDFGFFIGAFRVNGAEGSHPWQTILNHHQKTGLEIHTIHLNSLNLNDVSQFVSSSLQSDFEKCFDLSKLIQRKTLGNPFFAKEFLKSIYEKELLEFDTDTDTWQWKSAKIEEMTVTGTISALVMDSLNHVSPSSMELLKVAACLGNRFNINTLVLILGTSSRRVRHLLDQSVNQGVIVRINDNQKFYKDQDSKVLKETEAYKFSHDQFQNAAYSLINQKDKARMHWKIGRLLMESRPDKENREDILEIANHLNLGRLSITEESQKHQLAEINLLAAKKAKRASAYQAAFSYLEAGISIFCPDGQNKIKSISPWEKDYHLCLSLHEIAAEIAFLISSYDRMEMLAVIIDRKARELTDKAMINEVRIRALYAQNRLPEAIDLGISFASQLGEKLPKHPTKVHIIHELLKTKFVLRGRDIEQLANLPEMTDTKKRLALKILSSLVLPAFYARPNLMPLIVFKGVRLSIAYGNSEESLFGYAGYGLIMCGVTGDIPTGYQFGELAQTLLDKLDAQRIRARTMTTVHAFIRHWKIHLKETLPPLLEAHQSGLELGDHQYAAISAKTYCCREIYAGINLEKVGHDTDIFSGLIKKLNQDVVLNSILILHQVVDNLTGKSANPWQLEGNAFNYKKTYPLLEKSNDQMGMFTADLMHLILCFLFGKYDMALEHVLKIRKHLNVAKGLPDMAVFNFFESLSILVFLQNQEGKIRNKYLGRIRKNQKQLGKWSRFAPMNFEHMFFLVEAERFNLRQDNKNARKFYDLAIKYSNKNGYVNYEAIANELAGKFYLKQQDLNTAKDHIILAHHSYMRWGALGKSSDMSKRYSLFFQTLSFSNIGGDYWDIDIYSVLKASQAISKTMEFDKLMTELVRVVIEYSGAQKACLMLYSEAVLKIEVIATTDPDNIETFDSIVVDEKNSELPTSILYYTARSQQNVILSDASEKNKFSADTYIIKNRPLSILCIPLASKNTVKGVLYLENNLLKGAFSEKHRSILDVFTSQILISIENSQLYEALVKEIEEKDKAVSEIKTKQKLLKNISAELAAAEESERKTIAEDLHDSVGQSLAFSISRLKSLDLSDLHHTEDQILEILNYLNQTVNNIRSLTFQLSPPLLRDLGFEDTLEWLCEDVLTRYGLNIIFKNKILQPVFLDETIKLTLYRVVRELALNIVKHAKVKEAELTIFSENNYFFVIIKDNGAGFDVQMSLKKSKKFGLLSIYRRMEAINGEIKIFSEKTKGTEIIIKVAYSS